MTDINDMDIVDNKIISNISKINTDIRLRAHHGMCLKFFIGKGYSNDFAANMSQVKAFLEKDDPLITIVSSDDIICKSCPNLNKTGCESYDKVKCYDENVLNVLGLISGRQIKYSDFIKLVSEKIIKAGKREKICGDCEWSELCR